MIPQRRAGRHRLIRAHTVRISETTRPDDRRLAGCGLALIATGHALMTALIVLFGALP